MINFCSHYYLPFDALTHLLLLLSSSSYSYPLNLLLQQIPVLSSFTPKTLKKHTHIHTYITMGTSPHHYNHHHHHQPLSHFFTTKLIISKAIYFLIPLALLHFYLFPFPLNLTQTQTQPNSTTPPPQPIIKTIKAPSSPAQQQQPQIPRPKLIAPAPRCNYTQGRWTHSARGPLYNGTSCSTIKPGQNCMAHGRPDTGYLYWSWRPDNCRLREFNARAFLNLIRNKHLAFVGDSMARNQLESLICLLSAASEPKLIYRDGEENKFRRWVFPTHNATVSVFWSPFLVKGIEKSAVSGLNHNKLYLDSADEKWASELSTMDAVVFSTGHWFLHPAIYHENDQVIGCHHCPEFNHSEIGFFDVFRKAVRTTLKEVVRMRHDVGSSSNKFVVVTTFSPAHFEGEWDKAGACPKKEPYKEGEKEMEYMDAEMRKIELEEVAAAARKTELKIEALDVTRMALMRPDGHPGPYMYPNPFADGPKDRVQNDCVHWCLPGPIDAWNEILYEMVRRWKEERK